MTASRAPAALDDGALQELAHVLAHRLRGLVSGIEGYADLLTDLLSTREQRECALRIVEGTVRIERVLAELQHFSRPVVPVPVPLTVADVVGGVLAALDETDRARVQTELPVGVVLDADPPLLRQALLVLIQNALDADAAALRLNVTRADGAVRFDVWNAGMLDAEAARRAFVPFYTTKAQNLGVGLPIARRIAEAHGGTVALAANDPTDGVCFRLCVPCRGGTAEANTDATFADVL